jgi:hypothetical protein
MECYKILLSLAELASTNGNTYSITDYAFGFIPFKNGENKVQEVGDKFLNIAHWLLYEAEANNK